MRLTAAVLSALLLLAAGRPAAAQDEPAPDQDAPGANAQPPVDVGADAAPHGTGHKDDAPAVSQADARANAATLIQSFMAKHSEGGAFPLRDKTTKKLRRLKLVKVDEKGVEPAGGARFTAPAWLKDEETGQKLEASFTLDFTPPDWKVVGLRLKPPTAATSSPAESARKGR